MATALEQASMATRANEVPVGAVLVCGGQVIVAAHNRTELLHDPTAHAEMLVIKAGTHAISSKYLMDCELYVTLEPCPMCAYALSLAKIKRVYFGAYDEVNGAVTSNKLAHRGYNFEWYGGIQERECAHLLKSFFAKRR
jgi:tRNA(adenine34) deaminase